MRRQPAAAAAASHPSRRRPTGRRRRAPVVVALLAATALTLPAAARADHYLGSTLSVAATVAHAFQQDTTFWPTAIPVTPVPGAISNPDRAVVPENGQILQFQVRGFAGGGLGPQPIHFQDLRPVGGGRMKVITSSDLFMLPASDGLWSFDPTNFCVRAGDVLGFSDEGGFDKTPSGIPFQVFGTVDGAQTQYFSLNNGVKNGATLTPTALPAGEELLMAAYEGTGGHSSALCGGVKGIELNPPQGTFKVGAGGSVVLDIGCQGPLPCNGSLTLQLPPGQTAAKRKPKRRASSLLGSAHFKIPSRHTSKIRVKLTKRGRRLLRAHHGHLKVTLAVSAGAGGPANTTTSTLTLSG